MGRFKCYAKHWACDIPRPTVAPLALGTIWLHREEPFPPREVSFRGINSSLMRLGGGFIFHSPQELLQTKNFLLDIHSNL